MEFIPHTAWLAGAASAADQQGPGTLLRTVLAVLLVGVALTAWFLLRGYRGSRPSEDDGAARTPGGAGEKSAPGGAAGEQGAPADGSGTQGGAPAGGRGGNGSGDAGREQ
ncbi:hypothetical protein GCM10018793_62590 [Streptomyces sulfonofaciens]|uniref:Uncharacterized protein n=1 Tax=Streptomyces sulfonofaciens TaxID=68272 RepID=A0A919GMF9_9ACTN|nr:hypothetical protein [Streptomyces sulfonofaciens]GHH87302.1 hypothetical protein GCM10018793_62590 [Streptomyces sulfonofaciens]